MTCVPTIVQERDEAHATAELVIAGTDSIVVPLELVEEPEATVALIDESTKPLWARIRDMSVAQRVKLALKGNKEARGILLRDKNGSISRLVLQNPRLSEEEIVALSKDRNTAEDILGLIANSRSWTKIYAVRAALVENGRTPPGKAMRLLASLSAREISRLAKDKNVPTSISAQARRMLLQRFDRRH